MSGSSASRLDSILDEALDEFEEEAIASKISKMKIKAAGSDSDEEEDSEAQQLAAAEYARMQKLMDELNDPVYGDVVKQTLQSLNATQEGAESVDALFENLQAPLRQQHPLMAFPTDPLQGNVEFTDRNIAGTVSQRLTVDKIAYLVHQGTMQMLGNMQQGMEGFEASKLEVQCDLCFSDYDRE